MSLYRPKSDQQAGAGVTQNVERDHDPGHPDEKHRQQDGGGVPKRDRGEGLQDGASPLLLQAQGHREEPAHGRVEAVVGSQRRQREPGPALGHEA